VGRLFGLSLFTFFGGCIARVLGLIGLTNFFMGVFVGFARFLVGFNLKRSLKRLGI
jgi:hypothetical protein